MWRRVRDNLHGFTQPGRLEGNTNLLLFIREHGRRGGIVYTLLDSKAKTARGRRCGEVAGSPTRLGMPVENDRPAVRSMNSLVPCALQ
jgi:hypothetical protein